MLRNFLQRLLPDRKVAYGDQFFKDAWFSEWEVLKLTLHQLINEINPNHRILDFGCGPGVMIDHMSDSGFYYIGCDYSSEARQLYVDKYGKYPERYIDGLDKIKDQKFDLFLSFDVFEHMTDGQIDSIMVETDNIPCWFVNISRDRRTPGHINIKNDQQWIEFFQKRGFEFDASLSETLRDRYREIRKSCPDCWHKNMFVFRRVEGTI